MKNLVLSLALGAAFAPAAFAGSMHGADWANAIGAALAPPPVVVVQQPVYVAPQPQVIYVQQPAPPPRVVYVDRPVEVATYFTGANIDPQRRIKTCNYSDGQVR